MILPNSKLVKFEGMTVILTTHDSVIMELVDHVYYLIPERAVGFKGVCVGMYVLN